MPTYIIKLLLPLWLLTFSLQGKGQGITAISDTTDLLDTWDKEGENNDEDSVSYTTINVGSGGMPSFKGWFTGWLDDSFDDENFSFGNLFTGGSIVIGIIMGLVTLFILGLPILFVILLIYLLTSRRRKRTTHPNETVQGNALEIPETIEDKKDQAIMHMAVGVGIVILCWIIGVKVGIGIGFLLLCYGIGEYINAIRRKKRKDGYQ